MIAKDFALPCKAEKPSRSWKSHENAASLSALGGNRKFQGLKRAGSLTADHQVINRRVPATTSLPHRRGWVRRQGAGATGPVSQTWLVRSTGSMRLTGPG